MAYVDGGDNYAWIGKTKAVVTEEKKRNKMELPFFNDAAKLFT